VNKTAWVAWSNTDLNEGRGLIFPLFVCELKETALRKGKGHDVQGSDCSVTEVELVQKGSLVYGPIVLIPGSKEDIALAAKNKIADERKEKLKEVIGRAKDLGMSDKDINLLLQGLV